MTAGLKGDTVTMARKSHNQCRTTSALAQRILAGELPRKQLRLVQAWIELHRDELFANWELAANGEKPYKIQPL